MRDAKLSPKRIGHIIGFTKKDFDTACLLIDDDIRKSFINSDITWIDYKKESRIIQNAFIDFMVDGGKNRNFVLIAIAVKELSFKHPDYDFLYRENFHNYYKTNQLNQKQKLYLEQLPKKFGY